jgi:hypothetical protein
MTLKEGFDWILDHLHNLNLSNLRNSLASNVYQTVFVKLRQFQVSFIILEIINLD